MAYPENIDKKLFDYIKEKKNSILESRKIKKLNNALVKIVQSEQLNKVNNFVNAIDIQKANSILDEIKKLFIILYPISKEEFKENIKYKKREEILNLYEACWENEMKNLIKSSCEYIISKIEQKVTNKL